VLQYPNFEKSFILTTDASNVGLGAVLSQGTIGNDRPCSYASRSLNKHEQNYSTTEKELLAVVWAIKHYRHYLYNTKFTVVTDHMPLKGIMKTKNCDVSSKIFKLLTKITDFTFETVYKKGKLNTNADALSRNIMYMSDIDEKLNEEIDQEELQKVTNELDLPTKNMEEMEDEALEMKQKERKIDKFKITSKEKILKIYTDYLYDHDINPSKIKFSQEIKPHNFYVNVNKKQDLFKELYSKINNLIDNQEVNFSIPGKFLEESQYMISFLSKILNKQNQFYVKEIYKSPPAENIDFPFREV